MPSSSSATYHSEDCLQTTPGSAPYLQDPPSDNARLGHASPLRPPRRNSTRFNAPPERSEGNPLPTRRPAATEVAGVAPGLPPCADAPPEWLETSSQPDGRQRPKSQASCTKPSWIMRESTHDFVVLHPVDSWSLHKRTAREAGEETLRPNGRQRPARSGKRQT